MQENNFEKQVQQKMDGLTINPSVEVWQKLSVTIAKDKSNRKIFIILFLLLLLITTAGYFIFNKAADKKNNAIIAQKDIAGKTTGTNDSATGGNSKNSTIADKNSSVVTNTKTADVLAITTKPADAPAGKSVHHQKKAAVSTNKTAFIQVDKPVIEIVIDNQSLDALAKHKAKKLKDTTRQKLSIAIVPVSPEELGNDKHTVANADKLNDAGQVKEVVEENEISAISKQPIDSRVTGTTSLNAEINDTISAKIATGDKTSKAVANSSSKSKHKSAWKFGFSFSLGAATTKNGLLGVVGSGSGDASKAYADALQNSGGTVGSGTNPVYSPSTIKTGAGIVAGVFVQKSISAKTNWLIGVNFKRLSSSMMIGNRVDSSLFYNSNSFSQSNFYYRNGNRQNFKNHFNFIELPVAIRVQLGKQKKRPFYLNTGVSIAQLISSNALQFDAATGNYFQNNQVLNKTQLSVSAGLLFSLSRNISYPFLIGPDINFSLNKMANSGLYKSRHYSYVGVLLQKTIGKK